MNNPKNKSCLSSAKVGDILFLSTSIDGKMTYLFPSRIEEFPIIDFCNGRPVVISHFDHMLGRASGTLFKIKKC